MMDPLDALSPVGCYRQGRLWRGPYLAGVAQGRQGARCPAAMERSCLLTMAKVRYSSSKVLIVIPPQTWTFFVTYLSFSSSTFSCLTVVWFDRRFRLETFGFVHLESTRGCIVPESPATIFPTFLPKLPTISRLYRERPTTYDRRRTSNS